MDIGIKEEFKGYIINDIVQYMEQLSTSEELFNRLKMKYQQWAGEAVDEDELREFQKEFITRLIKSF